MQLTLTLCNKMLSVYLLLRILVCCRTGTDLYRELDRCSIGDEVDLEVLRGSEKTHLKVTLGSSS